MPAADVPLLKVCVNMEWRAPCGALAMAAPPNRSAASYRESRQTRAGNSRAFAALQVQLCVRGWTAAQGAAGAGRFCRGSACMRMSACCDA